MNHKAFLYTGPTATHALKHVLLFLTRFPNLPVWAGGFTWPGLISVPSTSSTPELSLCSQGFPQPPAKEQLASPSFG